MSDINLTVAGTTTINLVSGSNAVDLVQSNNTIALTTAQWDAQLSDIAGLAVTDGNFIVGDGSNWVAESGNTARTSLGLGTGDSPTFTGLTLNGALSIKTQNELRFYDNGNYVGFEAPALSANKIWVLPNADGGASEFLQTDGSGNLTWSSAGGTDLTGLGVDNRAARWDGTDTLQSSNVTISDNGGTIIDGGADEIQLTVQAHSSQTANVLEIQKSDGTVWAGFDERGMVFSDGGTVVSNFFAGAGAGSAATTGANNVAIGQNAGRTITDGLSNMLIGTSAGFLLTRGQRNVAIGSSALATITTGDKNVAIGDSSLKLTTGQSNTGVGYRTLWSLTTGGNNIAIGYESGYLTVTGANNVCIGFSAGYRNLLSDRLIIDNQQRADSATEITNSILYGVMAAAPANQTLRVNANLGINVTPTSLLHLGTATEALEIVDAGSAGATEQDWIEVEVGGNQGFIRVYAAI